MHSHHIVPRSRGGSDNEDNLLLLDPVEHAKIHALDFLEGGPWFDFRHEGWPSLETDLQEQVKREASRRRSLENTTNPPVRGCQRSESWKQKLSKLHKDRGTKPPGTRGLKKSEEERRAIGERTRQVMTGRKAFNNGERMVYAFECPEGFVPGRLPRAPKS
jgi:hypothetical protein